MRQRVLYRVGLAALLALLGWTTTAPGQVPYALYGDPVEDLRRALTSKAANRTAQVRDAVQALKSISDLRRALALPDWTRPDQPFRREIAQQFRERVNSAVKSSNPTTRLAAAELIGEIGTGIAGFDIPGTLGLGTGLMGVLGTPLGSDPFLAWGLLLGRDEIPAIPNRSGFMRTLTPQLLSLLNDPDPGVRQEAARSLGRINPAPDLAVPALRKMLRSDQVGDRRAAAQGLLNLIQTTSGLQRTGRGTTTEGVEASREEILFAAEQVVGAAHAGLADPDAEVRRLCVLAVQRSANALSLAIPEPVRPEEMTPDYRRRTTGLIKDFGPLINALKNQGPALARLINDPNAPVQYAARTALEELAGARRRLLRLQANLGLLPQMPPGPRQVRRGQEGLRRVNLQEAAPQDPLGEGLRPAVEVYARGISSPKVADRLLALEFLEQMDDAAAPAAPALIKAMSDPNKFVRWAAARTLSRSGPIDRATAEAALPSLVRMLGDPDLDLRVAAAVTLARFGSLVADAAPALTRATQNGDADIRIAAMRTLTIIGLANLKPETADAVVAAVTADLGNSNTRVRVAAAETLGRFGPRAQSAIPALRRALSDPEMDVRRSAGEALLDISGH